MKISLALSGGGVRATVFHLGVLARLARQDLLKSVSVVSSVSGGSLAVGLVLASSRYRWPTSEQFLQDVVPQIHSLLTKRDLQFAFAMKSVICPWRLISGRASVLADQIEKQWGIGGKLSDLPESPRMIINATCYETGKNWRFQRDMMGDYQTKYVRHPKMPLSRALAASAAVPGLIGPLKVTTRSHHWSQYSEGDWESIAPKYKKVRLWDGGVYDNLGIESLFKPEKGLREGTDFMIVSDASRPLGSDTSEISWKPGFLKGSMRLVDIATDQVRSLRARMVMEYFKDNPGTGAYLRIGAKPKRSGTDGENDGTMAMTDAEVQHAFQFDTTLRRLSHDSFSVLFRHGYHVADNVLDSHCKETVESAPQRTVLFKAA